MNHDDRSPDSRREQLRLSLQNPHPATIRAAKGSLGNWGQPLPGEDLDSMLDMSAGVSVRWSPEEGWVEIPD